MQNTRHGSSSMFARESDAVSPRLGDTSLAFSGRTLNSLHALARQSVFGAGYNEVSSEVCNLDACPRVTWRYRFCFGLGARNICENQSRQRELVKFHQKEISGESLKRRTLVTRRRLITLKVVAISTATVTATTAAVAQGARTR